MPDQFQHDRISVDYSKSNEVLDYASQNKLWTDEKRAILQKGYLNEDHLQLCYDPKRSYLFDKFRSYEISNISREPEPRITLTPENCEGNGDSQTTVDRQIDGNGQTNRNGRTSEAPRNQGGQANQNGPTHSEDNGNYAADTKGAASLIFLTTLAVFM